MILGLKNMFTYTYATTVTPEEYAIANGVRHAVIVPSVWSYARSENTRLAGGETHRCHARVLLRFRRHMCPAVMRL